MQIPTSDLETLANRIEQLRVSTLSDLEADGFCPDASTHLLQALAYLELAKLAANLADRSQVRAIADLQLGRE